MRNLAKLANARAPVLFPAARFQCVGPSGSQLERVPDSIR